MTWVIGMSDLTDYCNDPASRLLIPVVLVWNTPLVSLRTINIKWYDRLLLLSPYEP